MKNIIGSALHSFEVRRAEKQDWRVLEREVAGYQSPADRLDFEAMLDRHTDEETADIRRFLTAQTAQLI